MSLQTWLEEFMPEPADEAAEKSDLVAAEHSLRKWRGLTQDNAAKHGLVRNMHQLNAGASDVDIFTIDSSTCALCKYSQLRHWDAGSPDWPEEHKERMIGEEEYCQFCPIFHKTGDSCHTE